MPALKRRYFLRLLCSFLAVTGAVPAAAGRTSDREEKFASTLEEIIPDNPLARNIANANANANAAPGATRTALKRLYSGYPKNQDVGATLVRAYLNERIRQDFDRNRTVKAGGWLLARSEIDAIRAAAHHRTEQLVR